MVKTKATHTRPSLDNVFVLLKQLSHVVKLGKLDRDISQ